MLMSTQSALRTIHLNCSLKDPDMFFTQLEMQFRIFGIEDDELQFCHMVTALNNFYEAEVADIIKKPPKDNKYSTIKKALISLLSLSQRRKVKKMLESEELGDQTPSQLLRHMKCFATADMPDSVIQTLWRERLPPNLHT